MHYIIFIIHKCLLPFCVHPTPTFGLSRSFLWWRSPRSGLFQFIPVASFSQRRTFISQIYKPNWTTFFSPFFIRKDWLIYPGSSRSNCNVNIYSKRTTEYVERIILYSWGQSEVRQLRHTLTRSIQNDVLALDIAMEDSTLFAVDCGIQ